jgi:nucleoid-associated protein YgaU
MTREAKIGMLTGLGVIILIGVLLSNYLGDPNATMPGSIPSSGVVGGNATGQMAKLPVGAAYRREVTEPLSVPPMGMDGAQAPGLAGGSGIVSPINTSNALMPPIAYAVDNTVANGSETGAASGPMVRVPVSPLAVGPVPADRIMGGAPPMIVMAESPRSIPLPQVADGDAMGKAAPASTHVTYTIGEGDTLIKIAKKFYNSTKNSELQRIVAANPGVLKDVNSVLVQGKKLVIPNVAVAGTAKADPGMIPLPGGSQLSGGVAADPGRKVEAPKKATTIYTVQSGDTLQKIAKKFAPSRSSEMLQKLASVNGIKDPDSVQAGMKLKVPALADGN